MNASGKTMNCETYREQLLADPSAIFEGAEHAASCEACAAFREEVRALDARIAKALAISVPALPVPALPPVTAEGVVSLPVARRNRAPAWLALAASVVLAAVIVMQFVGGPDAGLSLADEILAHVDHEPRALQVTDVAVSDERLSAVVHPAIGTMDRNIGLISYAQSCIIRGREVPHLVIQGKRGPITLLLMPEEMVDGVQSIDGEGVNGVILPVGDGSIAIIGERDENLAEMEKRIIDSVAWSI